VCPTPLLHAQCSPGQSWVSKSHRRSGGAAPTGALVGRPALGLHRRSAPLDPHGRQVAQHLVGQQRRQRGPPAATAAAAARRGGRARAAARAALAGRRPGELALARLLCVCARSCVFNSTALCQLILLPCDTEILWTLSDQTRNGMCNLSTVRPLAHSSRLAVNAVQGYPVSALHRVACRAAAAP